MKIIRMLMKNNGTADNFINTDVSPVHLTRLFQFAYGMTPAEYIRRRRLTESIAALQDNSNKMKQRFKPYFRHIFILSRSCMPRCLVYCIIDI